MQSTLLLLIGIAITAGGIYLTVKHPLKWKIAGIGMTIGGIGINVLNFQTSFA